MVNVTLPTPASGLKVVPTADLNAVKATTQFAFTAGSTKPFVAVLANEDYFNNDDILYVVSTKAPFVLPKVVAGMYAPQPGGTYDFRVETHGALGSVDAMTGPGGFLDEFSNGGDADTPSGPRTGDGSYSLSSVFTVKIAP